jgi:hypothetical protein
MTHFQSPSSFSDHRRRGSTRCTDRQDIPIWFPQTITTDQRRQFESQLLHALAKLCGIQLSRTTPYHLVASGLVERFHRTLNAAIMCHADQRRTDALSIVLLGIRTSFKEDLQASVAELVYGEHLPILARCVHQPPALCSHITTWIGSAGVCSTSAQSRQRATPLRLHPFTRIYRILHTSSCCMMQPAAHWIPLTAAHTKSFDAGRRRSNSPWVARPSPWQPTGSNLPTCWTRSDTGLPPPKPRRGEHRRLRPHSHQPRRPHAPVAATASRLGTTPVGQSLLGGGVMWELSHCTEQLAGWDVPAPIDPPLVGSWPASRKTPAYKAASSFTSRQAVSDQWLTASNANIVRDTDNSPETVFTSTVFQIIHSGMGKEITCHGISPLGTLCASSGFQFDNDPGCWLQDDFVSYIQRYSPWQQFVRS